MKSQHLTTKRTTKTIFKKHNYFRKNLKSLDLIKNKKLKLIII